MTTVFQTLRGNVEWRPTLRTLFLGCGVVSSVLYVATGVIASLRYPDYRYADQQISELLAKGAPSRPFMVATNLVPYGLLMSAFAAGVWSAAGRTRSGRIAAAGLTGFTVFGTLGGGVLEMDRREVLASGEDQLRSTLHLPMTAAMAFCLFVSMGFAPGLLGKPLFTMLVFGLWVSTQAGQLQANEPTPWMGLKERVSSYTMMVWIALLAIGLLRAHHAIAARQLDTPMVRQQTVQRERGKPSA